MEIPETSQQPDHRPAHPEAPHGRTFPVRIDVVPQAPEGQRASVKLPWYNFFVREFFTRASLAADIEGALKAAAAEAAAAEDQNAYLFEAVARLLRSRVGTLSESVLPGA